MAKILVATEYHDLLPFAWRLKKEGHDVKTIVWKDRYEAAWDGLLEHFASGAGKSRNNLSHLTEMLSEEGWVVLADSPKGEHLAQVSGGGVRLYGCLDDLPSSSFPRVLGIQAWFDGESFQGHHVLVGDWGLWPGGYGPSQLGAITLCQVQVAPGLPQPDVDMLKSRSFRGLVTWWLRADEQREGDDQTGHLRIARIEAGWVPLAAHSWVSDLQSLGDVLVQDHPPVLERRFVVVVPLSVPPWPYRGSNLKLGGVQVTGWEPEDLNSVFLHDFKLGPKQSIETAGLDGLVGVVRGSANTLPLARARALDLLNRVQVPQKQFRPDAGAQVEQTLAALESLGLILG